MKFSTLLRRHRCNRGWTQRQLAAMAGLTQPEIAYLERDNRSPTLRQLLALQRTLRFSAADWNELRQVEFLPPGHHKREP